ncbi:MAG: hypothetical protein M1818_004035 [Claussenomyces sp. TS43310]|nr:MAG: hypothetical protein M1818_004035 [Claussenomyces sp. TS43310]
MGWLWSSTPPTEAIVTAQTSQPNPAPPSPSSTSPSSLPSQTSKQQSRRDDIAEAELRAFLEELEADVRPSSSKYNRVPQPTPPPLDPSPLSRARAPTLSTSLEEDLLPAEMSCRQAFDSAFYCQSLGGQFNNLYRHGGIRNCSDHWNEFWFCMKTKSTGDEQRADMIRDYYRRKGLKYKLGPSSEDVWQVREKRLEMGEAFSIPVEDQMGSDEEWNKREQVRRQGRVDGTT